MGACLVIPRGRRDGLFASWERGKLGFDDYMRHVEKRSLIPGRLRDCKIPLPALNLGVLATKEHALRAAETMLENNEVTRLAIKGLFSARTGNAGIITSRGTKQRRESSLAQFARRVEGYKDNYGDV